MNISQLRRLCLTINIAISGVPVQNFMPVDINNISSFAREALEDPSQKTDLTAIKER